MLTALPVGSDAPGRTVGPAFEIVRPAAFVLPHRRAAWLVVAEQLHTLAAVAGDLAADPDLPQLHKVADDLRGFAADLDKHIDARGERPS